MHFVENFANEKINIMKNVILYKYSYILTGDNVCFLCYNRVNKYT